MKKYIDIFPREPKKKCYYKEQEDNQEVRHVRHLRETIYDGWHPYGEGSFQSRKKKSEW